METSAESTHASRVAELLRCEAEAIDRAARQIDPEQVSNAVKLLLECDGKVILTGVGKSGFIARKIAATMTSTGTHAFFLHPSDALHGDIGIVAGSDVVVLLSNSGETAEILGMVPYLKHRGVPLIAVIGNLNSTLARQADVVLDASVAKEACPLNLAPTTSTAVALAIGDALAITLMELKGLSAEDFAANHPAGRLGKRLTLKVRDLMHTGGNNPTVKPEASWLEVVSAISNGGLGATNVVDDSGHLAGVVTDGDLRRAVQRAAPADLAGLTAQQIMTSHPVTVAPEELAYVALQLMENRPSQISVLPVTASDGLCVGLLRLHDIVRSGV